MKPTEFWLQGMDSWHDFYVILGTSAAGLIGLMFVVVTLAPKVMAARGEAGVHGFVTPTIVYFATVLVMASVMSMPALDPHVLGMILALGGVGIPAYVVSTGAHQQWKRSKLGVGDWFWYIGLPILSYLLMLTSALEVWRQARFALYVVATALLLLVIVGIRNAWDLVLWMAKQAEAVKAK